MPTFHFSSALLVLLLALGMSAIVIPSLRSAPHSAHIHFKRKLAQSAAAGTQTQGQRWFGGSSTSQKALPFTLQGGRASTASADGEGKVLRMLMFGKPGAGKGTLSSRLVKKYDILSFSTGDLLRQHIAEKTEVGRMAEEIVATGGLIPDDVMLKVVTSKLDALHNKHWILDGFPRTAGQGKLLDQHLHARDTPLSLVVNIDVADEIILGRISDRWIHLPSGRVYNLSYNPPKVSGLDDETGEPLTKRPDDNPETFARRLQTYYAATSPLLSHYAAQPSNITQLVSLAGATSDEIWPQLENVLNSAFPGLSQRQETREQKRKHSLSDAVLARQQEEAGAGVTRISD
ncbi:adenylate kinase-domain-containing protein [Irpex rosettiformis]|uniref:Adenylate kinase-domain-containing protein n=1 Tax=Irpex rosettiformis TaxID=378272 RepID=A0ACB8UH48_9APHY|nr:adenylate kinase-domain-containing protein [Irpex rosettiformis]